MNDLRQRFPVWVKVLLLLFLIWDAGFSFLQFYRSPLDGDVANLVVPGPGYERIFSEPLGLAVLQEGKGYGGSNRYFSHVAVAAYYNHVPGWLQQFVDPLDSVYLANSLIKLLIHLSIIGLLSWYALRIGRSKTSWGNMLLTLASFTALFQTYGNISVMGVIDPATTFNFFYSLPMLGLLLLLIPYFNWLYRGVYPSFSKLTSVAVVAGGLMLVLSGPLVAPSLLLIGAGIGLLRMRGWYLEKRIRLRSFDLALGLVMLLAVYSFWLGGYNVENIATPTPISERYGKLFTGLWRNLIKKPGLSLMLLLQIALSVRIWRSKNVDNRFRGMLCFLLLFAFSYLLLLPLGGYREYRPYILRWDTQLPITLALMLALVSSFLWVLGQAVPATWPQQRWRPMLLAGFALIIFYTAQDYHAPFSNECERNSIRLLVESEEELIQLPDRCSVMGWAPFTHPNQSVLSGEMLVRWGITSRPIRYVMPEEAKKEQ